MEAIIGLIGTIVGAGIAGWFIHYKEKQQREYDQNKERKKLLLEKYECIFQELGSFLSFANTASMQMITETGYDVKFDYSQVSKEFNTENLRMNIMFYAPELNELFDDLNQELESVVKAMGEFLLKKDISKKQKIELSAKALGATTKMSKLIIKLQEQLSKLAQALTNA